MQAFVRGGLSGLRLGSSRAGLTTPVLRRRSRVAGDVPRRRLASSMIRGFPNNFNNNTGNNDSEGGGRVFDELVDFPCVFTFKVVGVAQGDFMGDIVDSVALALETDKKFVQTSYRDRGKFRSITLKAPVNTASQIYDVYAAIDRDPRVKFKF